MPTYTLEYPPAQNSTYVKATTEYYFAYNTTNPANSLTGAQENQWIANGDTGSVRFHIDLGSGKIIRRIYYENSHQLGGYTGRGIKNFTFWGSNSSGSFTTLTYGTDTGWTQIDTSLQMDRHVDLDQADPKYILLNNNKTFRYYAFKIVDDWDGSTYLGCRRIVLQTEDGYVAAPDTPTNSTPTNGATSQSRNPTLTASAFSGGSGVHQASQWQIATDSGFTDVVWDSGTTTSNKTSVVVNGTNGTFGGTRSGKIALATNTLHYWHVRYQDDANVWSSYS